jgi:hypothetical protein
LTEQAPAIGFSVTTNLDGNRQIVLQGFFAADTATPEANATLDKVLVLADRQKARYELPEVEEELFKHRETLSQYEEDKASLDVRHQHEQARREVEIAEMERVRPEERAKKEALINADILAMQQHRVQVVEQGAESHRRSGRQGSYVPVGSTKANIERIDSQIRAVTESRDRQLAEWDAQYDAVLSAASAEHAKAEAERDFALKNLEVSIKRFQDAIANREAKIERLRATIAGD